MRDGIVIKVKDDSNKGGPTADPIKDNNEVWILHSDGSIAKYGHLKFDSTREAKIEVGKQITKGTKIGRYGLSGKIVPGEGSSSTKVEDLLHLHVQVDLPKGHKRIEHIPIESLFKGKDGNKLPKLQKGETS